MIDAQDHALNGVTVYFRLGDGETHEVRNRLAKRSGLPRLRKPRSYGSEDISSVKSVAHWLAKIVLGNNVPDVERFRLIVHGREHAVIRRDQIVLVGRHEDWATFRPHAGIDHDHVDRFRWEIFVGLPDGERAVENVVRDHAVRDVHNGHFGIDAQDHALHDPDQMVARAVIRRQCNNRPRQVWLLCGYGRVEGTAAPLSSTLTEAWVAV